jgi:hypothetical protein
MTTARRHDKWVGYVRVSSVDQNTDRQLDGLELENLLTDKASGKDTKTPRLQAYFEYVRDIRGKCSSGFVCGPRCRDCLWTPLATCQHGGLDLTVDYWKYSHETNVTLSLQIRRGSFVKTPIHASLLFEPYSPTLTWGHGVLRRGACCPSQTTGISRRDIRNSRGSDLWLTGVLL